MPFSSRASRGEAWVIRRRLRGGGGMVSGGWFFAMELGETRPDARSAARVVVVAVAGCGTR